jgi:hypothetical protein
MPADQAEDLGLTVEECDFVAELEQCTRLSFARLLERADRSGLRLAGEAVDYFSLKSLLDRIFRADDRVVFEGFTFVRRRQEDGVTYAFERIEPRDNCQSRL